MNSSKMFEEDIGWISNYILGPGNHDVTCIATSVLNCNSCFFHGIMHCTNNLYRESKKTGERHVICMNFKEKLSKAWKNQKKYGFLLPVVGHYDVFEQKLRSYDARASESDSLFVQHALKLTIIHIDLKNKKILWPEEAPFDEVVLIGWKDGICFSISLNYEFIFSLDRETGVIVLSKGPLTSTTVE